jgi:EmrB/QacA subfamily drug resistance transporter
MTTSPRISNSTSSEQRKFAILLTTSLVCSLIMLDANIVAVSLPTIARSLGASFTDIEWVVSAYVLPFAALLLAAGSYADRHGRKRTMLVGLAIFAFASGLCGLTHSALMLNLARALQGIGASLLLTAALAVINHSYVGQARAKAYAFWGACIGIAITSGPIIGGAITGFFGWRWTFLVNLPLCAVLFVTSVVIVEESRDHEAKTLDIAGILTLSSGLFLLIWGLIDGNSVGWGNSAIIWRFVTATSLFIAFVVVEVRQTRPMVDLALFAQPTFLGSAFAMLGYAGGAQVMIFYLPMYLQNAYGFAPAKAGLAMIPFALPMFLTPRLGGRLAKSYSGRALLTFGLMTTMLGNLLLYGFAHVGMSYPVFLVGMLVAGVGAGLLNSETAKVMQGAVPAQRAGMASGLASTTRFVGLLLGVAGLGAVLARVVSRQFISAGVALGLEPKFAARAAKQVASGDLTSVMTDIPARLQAQVHAAGWAAFAGGFAAASLVAAAVAALTGLLTYILVRSVDTAPVADDDLQRTLVAVME